MSEHEVVTMVAIPILVAVVATRIVGREMMVIMYKVQTTFSLRLTNILDDGSKDDKTCFL